MNSMLGRINAQFILFILIVGCVIFYYSLTAGQFEIFKKQVSAQLLKYHQFCIQYVASLITITKIAQEKNEIFTRTAPTDQKQLRVN
jgi:hypothetical protein